MIILDQLDLPVTSYGNSGGNGNRTGLITVTASFAFDAGALSLLVNGNTGSLELDEPGTGSTSVVGQWIQYDFPTPVYFDESKLYRPSNPTSRGPTTFKTQILLGGVWLDITSAFNIVGASPITIASAHPYFEGSTSYRDLGVSGNWPNFYWSEREFKIAPGSY